MVLLFSNVMGQAYKYLYHLDKDLLPVDKANALYIGKGLKDSAFFLVDCYEISTGKLSISVHFADSLLSDFEGLYKDYYASGKLKQEGYYVNGNQQGDWSLWDSTGFKTVSVSFEKGKQISFTEYNYYKGKINRKSVKDSLGNEKLLVFFDEKGNEVKEGKIYNRVDVQPVFPGKQTFQEYLIQNSDKNIPSLRGAPIGRYLAIINFVVDANGNITDVKKESLNGYGMEEEAIRAIKNSPPWLPAMQNGNKVSYLMREILPFAVSR